MQCERQYKALFSNEDKIKIFDTLASYYYNGNFGTFSKQQLDLLMFSEFLDKLIDTNSNFDDYSISKELGILQTNVRQLKKKKQLAYPREYRWEDAFLKYSENAHFDKNGYVVVNIDDPNVQIEVQHYIETRNCFVDYSLNSKLLKMPIGAFVNLLLDIEYGYEADRYKQALIKEFNRRCLKENEEAEMITQANFGAKIKNIAVDVLIDALKAAIPTSKIIIFLSKIVTKVV